MAQMHKWSVELYFRDRTSKKYVVNADCLDNAVRKAQGHAKQYDGKQDSDFCGSGSQVVE